MRSREQAVMTAILRLRDNAYGVTIREKAEELSRPRPMPLGVVYFTLDRLEEKGLISSQLADPTPERGDRAKRYYRVEGLGERVPVRAHDLLEAVVEDWGKERRPKWVPVRPK